MFSLLLTSHHLLYFDWAHIHYDWILDVIYYNMPAF